MAFVAYGTAERIQARRGLGALAAILGVMAAGLFMAAVFLWPNSPDGRRSHDVLAGQLDRFAEHKPVMLHLSDAPLLYVVNQGDGEYAAFTANSTYRGCTVAWLDHMFFNGTQGWFRDPCHGSTYNLSGECVYGRCTHHLDRVETRVVSRTPLHPAGPADRGSAGNPGGAPDAVRASSQLIAADAFRSDSISASVPGVTAR